ncbi:hypothetical protein QBC32DRAFT_39727 [Pseudoneurospora amorphoporcata]|uniref:Uncharacterized protein n=1 Tax=Pseudoneurospora amorphoporcata TaxID=241081 RepID=A0AAN6SID0_9PEZI|nr:hypothetical protein QBC32DRAFT_39727 [Pseudoneurospora amorphoporcata]
MPHNVHSVPSRSEFFIAQPKYSHEVDRGLVSMSLALDLPPTSSSCEQIPCTFSLPIIQGVSVSHHPCYIQSSQRSSVLPSSFDFCGNPEKSHACLNPVTTYTSTYLKDTPAHTGPLFPIQSRAFSSKGLLLSSPRPRSPSSVEDSPTAVFSNRSGPYTYRPRPVPSQPSVSFRSAPVPTIQFPIRFRFGSPATRFSFHPSYPVSLIMHTLVCTCGEEEQTT